MKIRIDEYYFSDLGRSSVFQGYETFLKFQDFTDCSLIFGYSTVDKELIEDEIFGDNIFNKKEVRLFIVILNSRW
jgi:hypothetical protein